MDCLEAASSINEQDGSPYNPGKCVCLLRSVYTEVLLISLHPFPTTQSQSLDSYYCQLYLHPNGRPPFPLSRQAPQLLPARDGLDDECGGLGAGTGRHWCQLEGACAHGGAVQPVRGAAAPGRALCCGEALVGRVGAALGGDGDAGWGLASRRDGGRGLSEVKGCRRGRGGDAESRPSSPHSHTHVVHRTLWPRTIPPA